MRKNVVLLLVVVFWLSLFGCSEKTYQLAWDGFCYTASDSSLDDIQKQREIGKRPYQKILLVIGSAAVTFAVCALIGFSDALLFELIVTCRRT